MNNMLRGLYRDNSDHAVTGTISETDLASTSIGGSIIGATGCLQIVAAGTVTGGAGTKRIQIYLGSTSIFDSAAVAGTSHWFVQLWIFNTSSSAQRIIYLYRDNSGTIQANYATGSVDTAQTQTLKVTGILSNTADTITQKIFDVFIAQIT
jgi:hypothetical protein